MGGLPIGKGKGKGESLIISDLSYKKGLKGRGES
jgi:hypothetical protein